MSTRLEAVLRLRRAELDRAATELGAALQRYRSATAERQRAAERVAAVRLRPSPRGRAELVRSWQAGLVRAEQLAEADRACAQQDCAQRDARGSWVAAAGRVRALERLVAQRRARELAQAERRGQRELDDLVAAQWSRRAGQW